MVATRQEAVNKAKSQTVYPEGMCQQWVRNLYGAPSVGDVDGNGRANAVDGWLSEPLEYRHYDKNPPAGVPVAWSGGSKGDGHRAISLGGGLIRSTDAAGAGKIGTQNIQWFERNWGLTYLGWSETISGIVIKDDIKHKPNISRIANQAIKDSRKKGVPPRKLAKRIIKKLNRRKLIRSTAKQVLDGKWGTGVDRVSRLKAAGFNDKQRAKIQKRVNKLIANQSK